MDVEVTGPQYASPRLALTEAQNIGMCRQLEMRWCTLLFAARAPVYEGEANSSRDGRHVGRSTLGRFRGSCSPSASIVEILSGLQHVPPCEYGLWNE